jgi:RNA polymerase sigma-70 factor, ECF subfamily
MLPCDGSWPRRPPRSAARDVTDGLPLRAAEDGDAVPVDRDSLLVAQAAQGDVDAFDALLRPRLPRLGRLALAIVRNEADARDAVQDACILAWRELPALRRRDRFDPWLAQIVVNACRGLLRGQNRRRVREITVGDPAQVTPEVGTGPAAGPERIAEAEAVQLAFLRLDPDARALIALHYVEERPLAEIASILGIPVGTVKWRLFRARRVLDGALKAEDR